MPHDRIVRAMLALTLLLVVTACGDASDETPNAPATPEADGRDPASANAAEPAQSSTDETSLPPAVDAEDAVLPLSVNVYSRSGYWAADGTLIVDVLEGDLVHATAMIIDAEVRPVRGLKPRVTPLRDSRYIPASDPAAVSGELGNYRFGLLGGTMGEERVLVAIDDFTGGLLLNVISTRASGYDWLADIEGVLDWRLLQEAKVTWLGQQASATFPDEIKAKSGETVRMVGFVMPLEASLEQKHFLLTSSPPGCFFHVPGGPAGAVEVFATKPLSLGFDPVVFEGRFEALDTSDAGVVYRLHEARILDVPQQSS